MTRESTTRSTRSWWRYLAGALAGLSLIAVASVLVAQRMSDGPLTAIIPGGPLRSGPLVSDRDVDWPTVLGESSACVGDRCDPPDPVELQLVDPPRSRYTGIMVLDGELYVPCDLGFMWNRFTGSQRRVLNLIYLFKTWHQEAAQDGRAVIRIDGKRYERQAVRVTDPQIDARLRAQLEEMARVWLAPEPLADAPTEEPNDIWFFRLDPRPERAQGRNQDV